MAAALLLLPLPPPQRGPHGRVETARVAGVRASRASPSLAPAAAAPPPFCRLSRVLL
jgi:hypothetical protein